MSREPPERLTAAPQEIERMRRKITGDGTVPTPNGALSLGFDSVEGVPDDGVPAFPQVFPSAA